MENKERNPSIDAPKDDIVIPGHVVKHDRTFKDKEEGEERMRGVHSENVGGTSSEDEDLRTGINLSNEDRVKPDDADASRLSI